MAGKSVGFRSVISRSTKPRTGEDLILFRGMMLCDGAPLAPTGGNLERRAAQEKPLAVVDLEFRERAELFVALDPFRDHLRLDAAADRGQARDDLALDGIGLEAADERVGDLDVVGS